MVNGMEVVERRTWRGDAGYSRRDATIYLAVFMLPEQEENSLVIGLIAKWC